MNESSNLPEKENPNVESRDVNTSAESGAAVEAASGPSVQDGDANANVEKAAGTEPSTDAEEIAAKADADNGGKPKSKIKQWLTSFKTRRTKEFAPKPVSGSWPFWMQAVAILGAGALTIASVVAIMPREKVQPEAKAVAAIAVMAQRDFLEDGVFEMSGLNAYSVKEIEKNLRFEPPVSFHVEKKAGSNTVIMLENYRNIAYTGIFQANKGKENEETIKFEVNAPALTVRLGKPSASVGKYDGLQLVFSEQVDIYSLEKNLTIEPRTSYKLSYNLNVVTITPDVEWITTNNYQIKINADYTSKTGKQFAEKQLLSFKVPAPKKDTSQYIPPAASVHFQSNDNFLVNENDELSMTFIGEYLNRGVPVLIETYRMDSLEKYKAQGHVYLGYDIDLDSLEKLDTNAFLVENGAGRFSVPNFGAGAYILCATYKDPHTKKDMEVRTSYLVTPLSVYMQASAQETVVWLNSSEQDAPLSGYTVTFGSKEKTSGITDQNGMLILPQIDTFDGKVAFSITDPDGVLVYYDDAGLYRDGNNRELYYSYLFLDRTIYKPEDTVCFWGFVKPFRYNEKTMPDTVVVTFDKGGLELEVEVPLEPSGVYHGEIPLEKIKSTQYSIEAALHFPGATEQDTGTRHVLETEYVSVKEFQKPTFVLTSEVDKDYYGPEDTVTVTANASFYDGTPLPSFPVEASYYDAHQRVWVSLEDVKTDASGNAVFTFPANAGGAEGSGSKAPEGNRYRVQIANDGEQVTSVNRYICFPSDTLMEYIIRRQPDGKNLQLEVHAYELNMDSAGLKAAMERAGGYYYDLDNARLLQIARGEPVDADLEIELRWTYTDMKNIEHRNRQKSSGGYTQFDNAYSLDYSVKESIKTVDDWETEAKRISVKTKDGVAIVRDLIYLHEDSEINFDENVVCRAAVNYKDGFKNPFVHHAYYPNAASYDSMIGDSPEEDTKPEPIPGYSFAITDLSTGENVTPMEYYYRSLDMNAQSNYRFELLLDSEPVETNGRMLYSVIQSGLYEHQILNGHSFDLQYKTDYGKNVRLVAVYFDGEKTHYVKQMDLNVINSSLAVNLEVTPDKSGYRPGEQVSLQIKATDYLGRGVAGNLCVSVVDESIFALSEQEIDVLYSLYSDMQYYQDNSVRQYCTTYRDDPFENTMYDGGKSGSDGVEFYDSYRSNFKDTALFLPATTDAAGNGYITFTLPDNTTSWRITAVEIGNDLRAGQSKSNIISSLPFFVKPVITSKYIDGDDIAMLVQGHGTLLNAESDVNYTVTVTGDDTNITLNGQAKAYQAVEFNFGKLPIGSYTVVSRAQYSGYSDTVELPLNVIKSNLELVINKKVDVTEKLDINAVRYPVTLTLYDKSNEAFLSSINSLFGHYCMQANQRLSRFVAKRVVRQTVENGSVPYYIAEGNDYASDMQNHDGGIGYAPGEESEPLVTTYVLLVAKDQFNLRAMSQYYRDQLESIKNSKERAACYLGLAAIGDIEAEEILEAMEQESTSADVQAYLIAALAYLGETEQATTLYEQKLAGRLAQMNNGLSKSTDWDKNAAAIWIAASKLEHPDADQLSIYFAKAPWRYRTLFECMIYVTNYSRKITPTQFSYTIKGATKQVDLGLRGMTTLVLSKSDLESLRFSNIPDSLQAVAYYVGEPSEMGLQQSKNMSIEKSIEALDDDTYKVTLAIHLTKDAPMGQYDLSDWIPSNSRLYDFSKSYRSVQSDVSFKTTSEGQKLYVSFNNRMERERTILYTYLIRQTYQAEAMLDTTYLIHGDSGENCNSEKTAFLPQPAGERIPPVKAP